MEFEEQGKENAGYYHEHAHLSTSDYRAPSKPRDIVRQSDGPFRVVPCHGETTDFEAIVLKFESIISFGNPPIPFDDPSLYADAKKSENERVEIAQRTFRDKSYPKFSKIIFCWVIKVGWNPRDKPIG